MRGRQYRKGSIKKDSGGEDWMELDSTRQLKSSEISNSSERQSEKQLSGKGNSGCSGAEQEFADGCPSGRSSQRVEGTTNSVCPRDVRIHSC
jgi:hypothetical protein